MNEITQAMRDQLRAPIEAKYLKTHPTKNYLTVISPMAVVERLNDVFGIGAWRTHVRAGKVVSEGKRHAATCMLILDIPAYGVHLEQYGGSTNDDSGDALKGAATDALTKCASYLEIGFEIYSGERDRASGSNGTPKASANKAASDKQRAMIADLLLNKPVTPEHSDRISAKLTDPEWTSKAASETITYLIGLA